MDSGISDRDITDYVLNELGPRERLYVESMMLGCDQSRREAENLMELSSLLEEGMLNELLGADLSLDEARREKVSEYVPSKVWHPLQRTVATIISLAACVAFSVAAPVVSKIAFKLEPSKAQLARQIFSDEALDVLDPGAFPIAMIETEESLQGQSGDDFPTRVLLPTGAVNFGEMPMPYLGGELN